MELIRVAGVNAIPGWNLSVLNFAYHVPKPWTDRFAHVRGKEPQFRNEIVPVLNFAYHLPTPWTNRDLPINLSLQQVSHGVSMCLRYSHPLQGVSRTLSSLCFRLKNSEKIVLVLKAESKAVVELALPRPQNELQRTYSFGIFVRVVCFVTKP